MNKTQFIDAIVEKSGLKTGETIKIAASKHPAFTAGKALKDSVN